MNWHLAIEKNLGALKHIVAMLVAMVETTAGNRSATLPRHLHRLVLRLLRPAEAATRRLIIIAARGLVVKLPKPREHKPRPKNPPFNRKNGYGIVIRPGPLPQWARDLVPKRSATPSLPLLDPMKRFGIRRRYAKPSAMPQIRVLGGDPIVPLFRRPEPPPPPAPTPDDPLDAGNIHGRLDAIARALDDLPGQAQRMARWQARRDERLAGNREQSAARAAQSFAEATPSPSCSFAPPSVLPDISPARGRSAASAPPLISRGRKLAAWAPPLISQERRSAAWAPPLISSLVGEMSGRTEGGNVERSTPRPPRSPNAASTASPPCGPVIRPDGGASRTTTSTMS